ncbi:putative transcriptional regulator of N-Acetylglucosamine utilization, GntR family [Gilliamella apicola]|uniref:GntR family transcriptional regulator n=1 Tax=Gilliamella apicola TaxID=1196095 RepID=UPI00042F3910|nr:GntR family transcriptional regulator [Gilliamella apicola]AHN25536.1 putative transcriptional regulator of N-Acetylglucosamine utilization, GntR family [Gilliamella apicola]OTQ27716.1 transcriptional regulator [Gilliamella apicola]PXV95231.1 GntR family transcriptional regulator [Gilliamella apicola]
MNHINKMPRHLTIQQDLLKKIQSGVYPQGQLIPKECELTEIYQVSRPTVRQAIQQLVNDGYLERRKRRGTIVKQQKISQEFTHIIESYDSEMNRKGLHPKTKVLTFKLDKANADIANNLQINEYEDVYKLVRLRYAESKPVVLVTTYLPAKLLPNFINNDFTQEKLYSVLQKMDFPILQIRRKLEVLKADETTSDLLDIEAGDPIFYFHSIAFTNDRLPIEYSISKYRGDINSFVFELNHAS